MTFHALGKGEKAKRGGGGGEICKYSEERGSAVCEIKGKGKPKSPLGCSW